MKEFPHIIDKMRILAKKRAKIDNQAVKEVYTGLF